MFDEQVNELMHSIYRNAAHNLNLNYDNIEHVQDSIEHASAYLEEFASAVSRDIHSIEDKEQLLEALEVDLIENAWITKVLLHYREELMRNMELEAELSIDELMHESPKPQAEPVYKFEAKNS